MAYRCPRCGKPVRRARSAGAHQATGLVGALVRAAVARFECPKCGRIRTNEFPSHVRLKMRARSIMMVGGAIAVLVLVIWLIVALD